jgi:hypothetical protein
MSVRSLQLRVTPDPAIVLPLQQQYRTRFEVVPHHTCSLDVAPSDFCLFAALKKCLKLINFTCDEDVQASAGKWF